MMNFNIASVIALVVGVAVIASVIPTSIETWDNATADIPASYQGLWAVGIVIIIAGVIYGVARHSVGNSV